MRHLAMALSAAWFTAATEAAATCRDAAAAAATARDSAEDVRSSGGQEVKSVCIAIEAHRMPP